MQCRLNVYAACIGDETAVYQLLGDALIRRAMYESARRAAQGDDRARYLEALGRDEEELKQRQEFLQNLNMFFRRKWFVQVCLYHAYVLNAKCAGIAHSHNRLSTATALICTNCTQQCRRLVAGSRCRPKIAGARCCMSVT